MHNDRVILHLDMDAFFASCEQANNRALKNKAVLISRDKDKSIIIAASYEAREYQVKAGMPLFEAKKRLGNSAYVIMPGDRELYETYSEKIFNIIKKNYTHKVEILGIDECYIDATEIWQEYGSVHNLCLAIQASVYQQTSLTCSIGASFTCLFAKMGSDMDKPNGISLITRQNYKVRIWNQPIANVIGIGSSAKQKMLALQIKTVDDFVKLSDQEILKNFNNVGLKLKQKLLGIKNNQINFLDTDHKSISKERTFSIPLTHLDELSEILFELTTTVNRRLMQDNLRAKTIQLSIKYKTNSVTFSKKEHIKRKTFSSTLEEYTDNLETIYSIVQKTLYDIFSDEPVSLIGVGVSNLVNINKIVNQTKLAFES